MNFYLIEEYVNRMNKSDVNNFALKQGLVLNDKELDTIFYYIKSNYKTILYGNPREILLDIKKEVEPLTYNKIENLYMKFKDKIDIFIKKE